MGATRKLRVAVAATEFPGHAFPEFALAAELRARGHDVLLHTSERWRSAVADLEVEFIAVEQIDGVPHHGAFDETLVRAVRGLAPVLADFKPDMVVSDQATAAPPLAAELAGARTATVLATVLPIEAAGLPPYPLGFRAARGRAGRAAWSALRSAVAPMRPRARRLRQIAAELAHVRAELGLPAAAGDGERMTAYGPVSEDLALVATFPQLEYPRAWPEAAHVVGPLLFEPPGGTPPTLPPGDGPLIVVSGSTSQDPELHLVRVALEALAEEPVRVLATTGGHDPARLPQPANATVARWISPRETLPHAALTIARGGHGTVSESLAAGVPLLICPGAGDMPENGARVAWAGAGRMLPGPLLGRRALRSATRALLADPAPRRRASELASWYQDANPPTRAAELIEALGG